MLDSYEGRPGDRGLLVLSDEETTRIVSEAAAGGIGVAIHAIGDRAVRTALDGIEATLRHNMASGAAGAAPRFPLGKVPPAPPGGIARRATPGGFPAGAPLPAGGGPG